MDNDWALVVGINNYPLARGLPALSGAVRDAEKFFQWVTDPMGGAVPDDGLHARLLTSPAGSSSSAMPSPLLGDLHNYFDALKFNLNGRRDRRLYIYLSGHGISPAGVVAVQHVALLLANTRPPGDWPNFPGDVWAEGARSTAAFREVVLVMDCCQDLEDKAAVGDHTFGTAIVDSTDCHTVEFYATQWGSKAREGEFGAPGEKMGTFTHSLLEVLKAGCMDGQLLKASVLEHYARKPALGTSPQRPRIGSDDNLPLFTFNEAAAPPVSPVIIRNHADPRPRIQFLPAHANRSSPVDMSGWELKNGEWHGSMGPGNYEIRTASGNDPMFTVYAGSPAVVDAAEEGA